MLHRCSEDRIDHNVPSYGRNHIGTKDKWRKDVLEQIGGSGDRYRRGSPHDSGQEDGTESTWSKEQWEPVEGHWDKRGLK